MTSTYAHDDLNRLTVLTHAAGANTLIGNQYTYNDASNITNWANASGNHAYGYDAVDRLTSATNSARPNENYSYDGVGNRTTSHLSASYSYQPFNKLTSTANASYTYDSNGNMLTKTDSLGTTTFSWSEENQLTQVTLPNGLAINYKYDGLGRRIQRTTSAGASERYVYDGQDVLLDLNGDWSVAMTYLSGPGIDNHLRQTSGTSGVSYYLTDHLGSFAGLTDAAGNIVEQIANDSFGNGAGNARTRYGYTGRELDPDTGQLYYRARFYDPQVGRFISEDPIGFRGRDVNFYGYVHNGALRFVDPSGLRRCNPILGAIVGAMLGGNVGGGAGAVLGAVAGGSFGALGGTFVIPGFGTIVGGGGGVAVGAGAGAFAGSAIGIAVGIGAGIDYCNGDDTCDTNPRAVPQPTPNAAPMPPAPPQNPDDNCDEQWRRAIEICESSRGRSDRRGITGGYNNLLKCARGLVSRRCGGGRVEY